MIVQKHALCSCAAHRFMLGCHHYGCLLFCPSAHIFHVQCPKSVLTRTLLPSSPTMRLGSRVVSMRKPRSRLKRMRTVKSWTSRTSMSADCGTRKRPTWDWKGRLVSWRRRSVCSGYRHRLCCLFFIFFSTQRLIYWDWIQNSIFAYIICTWMRVQYGNWQAMFHFQGLSVSELSSGSFNELRINLTPAFQTRVWKNPNKDLYALFKECNFVARKRR